MDANMLSYFGRGITTHGQNPSFLIFHLHTGPDCMKASFTTIKVITHFKSGGEHHLKDCIVHWIKLSLNGILADNLFREWSLLSYEKKRTFNNLFWSQTDLCFLNILESWFTSAGRHWHPYTRQSTEVKYLHCWKEFAREPLRFDERWPS